MTSKWLIAPLAAVLLSGCEQDPARIPCGTGFSVPDFGKTLVKVTLAEGESCVWPVFFPPKLQQGNVVDKDLLTEIRISAEVTGEAFGASFVTASMDGVPQREAGWVATGPYRTGEHTLRVEAQRAADIRIEIDARGELMRRQEIGADTSLEWLSGTAGATLLDVENLARMLRLLSEDGHGGRLLAHWLESFETTAHSSRPAIAALGDQLHASFGADPLQWPVDTLPFALIAVENRLDLRTAETCGELRFVYAATSPGYESFRMVFRFGQPPVSTDRSPAGTLTCIGTAQRWAELSRDGVDPIEDTDAFINLMEGLLKRTHFISIRTHEAAGGAAETEFREWRISENTDPATQGVLPTILTNVPLFQTVDVPRLNQAGPDRDAFLAFVNENAAGLDARTTVIPAEFLATSLRAAEDAWSSLDLSGLPAETQAAFPQLRKNIEVMGCAGCHLAGDAFSLRTAGGAPVFMSTELGARLDHLRALSQGQLQTTQFGPLQANGINHLP